MSRTEVLKLIYDCVQSLNVQRLPEDRLACDEETALLGPTSKLDSLAFVSFVADLEDRVMDLTGIELLLAEAALTPDNNPFRAIRSLADLVAARVGAHG